MLGKVVSESQRDWDGRLPAVLAAYRASHDINYPASYEVVRVLQMTWKISGSAWKCFGRGIIDRMRKQETVCSACMCLWLACDFLRGRGVFLLLYMEGSFVLLPADDMTTAVDIRSHVTTRQWMEICLQHVGNCCKFQAATIEFICFSCKKCWLVVQQGCKSVILAPLHLNKLFTLKTEIPESYHQV